ncbi:MAG: CBS domain-containing protein [Chloroflexi bacterium]|nr:CBS domain-containing protein [Chloroflexota bacterium]
MPYVSDLMGKPVADIDGERVGQVEDLIAAARDDMPLPQLKALVVKRQRGLLIVPLSAVAVLIAPAIPLTLRLDQIIPLSPDERDFYLVRDILDKQIIDINGVRLVRVNDVEIVRVGNHFYISNVDIGGLGLLRRLGLARLTQKIVARLGRELPPGMISWHDMERLPGSQTMRLRVPSDKITNLHPADLAEILSDLSRAESSKFLESLDVKTVADTLEAVEPEFQANLVETMDDERVADVLGEMSPDEAADLLAELPEDRSEELLRLMEDEDAQDVRKLLAYPEDSAGGIMTTEYIALSPKLTAAEAIQVLRETAHEAETIFYIYITDVENHLLGVLSLRDLVLAQPETPITDFMHQRMVSVNLLDAQDKVAEMISKYNLVAVPVVDDDHRLQGIVTADDALDKIIPTAWKKRLPRLYH